MRGSRSAMSTSSSLRTAAEDEAPSPFSSTSRSRHSSSTLVEMQHTPRRSTAATPTSAGTLKRKRAATTEKEEEVRLREQRLKVAEKNLREREREVKKLESAARKKRNEAQRDIDELARTRKALEKRITLYETKHREVDQQAKAVETRNKAIEAREKTLKKLPQGLAQGTASASTESAWAFNHLEEHYTCSLCYDILACPYTLSPGQCGHSFCAMCILQWSFAAVHRGCGFWHDSLECPLCRAELPYTSDHVPRSMFSFPFTPNRLSDTAIHALIEGITKREGGPNAGAGEGSGPGVGMCVSIGQGKSDATISASLKDGEKLSAWKETGMAYLDWKERDRGRAEMTLLATEWASLGANDFVAFKDRLGV
ncbi:hypothetical protein BC628DRAFT_587334 [Trametes gibbosa]|uniref:RING-type domain-containing protein n=1 Tax=Trametes gibbosa TaxID=160864 RepID=A0A6G6FQ87_9APHY|nr:hypothetical protein BC628DRAFT_587334 [Trametes gibbosa]QIE48476.1 hypothetical protein [Trametes gibbosa]